MGRRELCRSTALCEGSLRSFGSSTTRFPNATVAAGARIDSLLRRRRRCGRAFLLGGDPTQAYSQGANTQAIRDARQLVDHLLDDAAPPDTVRAFAPDESALRDVRRRNESLLRGLMCLLVIDGAPDLGDGRPLAEHKDLVLLRLVPSGWLLPRGVNPDAIINFTLASSGDAAEWRERWTLDEPELADPTQCRAPTSPRSNSTPR